MKNKTVKVWCDTCDGTGEFCSAYTETCCHCKGQGYIEKDMMSLIDVEMQREIVQTAYDDYLDGSFMPEEFLQNWQGVGEK